MDKKDFSEIVLTIHERLAAILNDVQAIGKDSKNVQQNFSFRGIDAVMNHLHPLFAKHGVLIFTNVIDHTSERLTTAKGTVMTSRLMRIRFDFVGAIGDTVSSTVFAEAMDSGDKASAKCLAIGLKYALTQMLLLPYEEIDPDGESVELAKHEAKPSNPAKQPVKQLNEDRPTGNKPLPVVKQLKDGDDKWLYISEKQAKRLFAIAASNGVTAEILKAHVYATCGVQHSNEIPPNKYEELCAWAERGGQDEPTEEQQSPEEQSQNNENTPF